MTTALVWQRFSSAAWVNWYQHAKHASILNFIGDKDDRGGGDNWSLQQTNVQLFTGRMPFLSLNQQWESTLKEKVSFHGLPHPELTWDLRLFDH